MTSDIEDLLKYCVSNGRICPQPARWSDLYSMLPDKQQRGAGFEPPAPLILAAWWEASDEMKKDRLIAHVKWASNHGALKKVDNFLRLLAESEWHHG